LTATVSGWPEATWSGAIFLIAAQGLVSGDGASLVSKLHADSSRECPARGNLMARLIDTHEALLAFRFSASWSLYPLG